MKNVNQPPRWAKRVFSWYADEHWHSEILGDLEEQFQDDLQHRKRWQAKIRFCVEMALFLRPHILKRRIKRNSNMLIYNHIKISYRNLIKNKVYSLINTLGLTIGMAACLLIYIYVRHDLSYDDFQDDNVYRMWVNRVYPEREVNYPFVPHSFGPQLVEDFPEVIDQGRCFKPFNPTTVRVGEDFYIENDLIFADSSFLTILKFQMKYGDQQTALHDPNSVVLSATTARKLFGDQDPVGRTIEFGGNSKKVTGVAYDYPANSHFQFDYLTALHQLPFFTQKNWVGFSAMTYLKFKEGTDPNEFLAKVPAFVKQYAEGPIQKRNGISYDEYVAAGNGYNYNLHHIKDIYLRSDLENDLKANGNINYIYIFSAIAVFILMIACINFMNLSTARSTDRGKEVGVRKVLGSAKKQLIGQFLTESIMMAVFSAILAIGIVYLVMPQFSALAQRPLEISELWASNSLLVMLLITIGTGILAGIYPAFFISSFAPLSVLKGKLKSSKGGINLRNGLVVAQFAISITLISATYIVFDQMNYMLNKPLGFDKENVLVVENVGDLNNDPNGGLERFETFKKEINSLPEVQVSAYTSNMPGDLVGDFVVKVPGTAEKESMVMRRMVFDEEIPETLNITLSEGRFFSPTFNDSLSIVLNESAVRKLGIQDPVGKKLVEIAAGNNPIEYTIIGVVADFHFQSLRLDLKPSAITSMSGPFQLFAKMAVKVKGDPGEVLQSVESKWSEFVVGSPFKSYFLDNDVEQFYAAEKTTGRIFGIFTFLAILIACVGLLGLSAFIINQRIKEIGVRKVLGASVLQIIVLLSKGFMKLILISSVISMPIAYLWMSRWLENFAYSVNVNWLVFLLSGFLAMLIGVLVVCFQSVRAAIANPVESLRDE